MYPAVGRARQLKGHPVAVGPRLLLPPLVVEEHGHPASKCQGWTKGGLELTLRDQSEAHGGKRKAAGKGGGVGWLMGVSRCFLWLGHWTAGRGGWKRGRFLEIQIRDGVTASRETFHDKHESQKGVLAGREKAAVTSSVHDDEYRLSLGLPRATGLLVSRGILPPGLASPPAHPLARDDPRWGARESYQARGADGI